MEILNSIESINNFIKENRISMVYFSSNSCNVCINLLPKIQELLKSYPLIRYGKVEIDKVPEAAGTLSISTYLLYLVFLHI